jgi:hypothetical protein
LSKQQQQKIVQYLNEAHATELALVRELQAQIAMTPKGGYRDGLEQHLEETRQHSRRIEERLGELGQGSNPLQLGVGLVQAVAGQALALAKAPLNVVRGSGGEEKVLKNAKTRVPARRSRSRPTRRSRGSPASLVTDGRSVWPSRCWRTSSACSTGCLAISQASPMPSRARSSRPTAPMT